MRNFEYLEPGELKQATKTLEKEPGTVVMAGGTDLLDLLKSDIVAPERVLNLKAVQDDELRRMDERGGKLHIGALVTLTELAASPLLAERYPVLQQAAASAATPQLRNVGTLGGNLCQRPRCWYFRDEDLVCLRRGGDTCYAVEGRNRFHAVIGGGPCYIVHPSDTAVALLALGAEVLVRRGKKTRAVPIGEFFVRPETDPAVENILRKDEVVVGVEVPEPAGRERSSYTKFKFRDGWDFAVVSVALVTGGDRRAVALGGVAPVPWLDHRAGEALGAVRGEGRALDAFAAALLVDAEPMTENEYKVPLARNLARRAALALVNGG